jgi:hypothetical protein
MLSSSPAVPARPLTVLAWVLALKVLVLSAVYALATQLPQAFNVAGWRANFHWSDAAPSAATWFQTWDGMHYLYLSEHGYTPGHPTTAYYPLWPLLIAAATLVLRDPLIAALLLSNLLSAFALWLLHDLVRTQHSRPIATSALVLQLAYPGSLFFFFPYTESLFLCLTVALFWLLARERYVAAAGVVFLAVLARPVGVFCALPLLHALWTARTPEGLRRIVREGWLVLAAPAGLAAYFATMALFTDDPFAGVKAQQFFKASPSIGYLLNPLRFVQTYLDVRAFHGFLHSFVDRFWFTVFVLLLPAVWKLHRGMFWYVLAVGLFSAMTSDFMSFTRYLSVLFPVFVAAATLTANRKWLWIPATCVLALFQLIFLFHHIRFVWVG